MNLTSIKPQNLIAAAALVAPIAMVQAVRLFFGGGPDQAGAMTVAPANTPAAVAPSNTPPVPVLSARQKAAAEFLKAQQSSVVIYNSPFNHLLPKTTVIQPQQQTATPVETPTTQQPVAIPAEIKALTLGALMRNDHGAFAMISGKVRTVGDAVIPGWTITEIDPQTRRVTITSDDGTAVYLTPAN